MAQALTPDVLVYGLRSADDPQIAPDGSAVLYLSLIHISEPTRPY